MATATITMTKVTPKKHVVRFDADEAGHGEEAPIGNVYVNKVWVDANGGCPKGVKVTLEPIQ